MKLLPLAYLCVPAILMLVALWIGKKLDAGEPEQERDTNSNLCVVGSNPTTGYTPPDNFEQLIDEAGKTNEKTIAA